jgi:AsmA protein
MSKLWLRRVALGLLGLAVLVAAGVAWFVASFDADRYKGLAIDWMKREHGRTLAIDGPVKLSVLPRLEVQLSKLRLSEQGRADAFASIDEAGLAVGLLPLLSRQLVVERISAKGVHAVYTRDAKGRRNIDDLLGADAKARDKANDTTSTAPPAAFKFDIRHIDLEDVRASVDDRMIPLSGELTLVSLKSGRLAGGVTSPVSLEARLALRQPALNGRLAGQTQLMLDAASGSAKASDMKLEFKGDAAGATAIDARIGGTLAYAGGSGAMSASDLALDLDATLGALKLTDSHLKLASFAFDPAKKAMALAKLQLGLAGQQGKDPLAFTLDWPQLDVQGETLKGSPMKGSFSLAGTNAVDGRFESGAPAGSFEQIRLPGLTVALKGRNGPRQFEGQLKSELLLKPEQRAASFDRLELQAKVQEASAPPLALTLRGAAHASAKDAGWKVAGSLHDNKLESQGAAQFGAGAKSVPNVQAEARFDSLDLNQLLPPPSAASAPVAGSAADAPIDLAGLRAVNGKFGLRAGRFAYRQYRVADARIDATLANGLLRVPTLQGKAFGGSIDASGFADATGNKLGAKLAGSGVDVNALLKDVAGFDRLEGTGRVSADVQSSGRSVAALRRGLGGTASLALRDGAIKGFNLAKALRQAKAALSLKQDAAQRASQTEKTDFSELNASFRIADGVARNSDLDLKSPFLRLGGEGAIDIGRGRIDDPARATVDSTATGQGADELAALKGLTVPVKLSGPFEAVDWSIQWSAIAAGALKNEVQNRLGEALGKKLGLPGPGGGASSPPAKKPEDLLKDRLKGLLR